MRRSPHRTSICLGESTSAAVTAQPGLDPHGPWRNPWLCSEQARATPANFCQKALSLCGASLPSPCCPNCSGELVVGMEHEGPPCDLPQGFSPGLSLWAITLHSCKPLRESLGVRFNLNNGTCLLVAWDRYWLWSCLLFPGLTNPNHALKPHCGGG